MPPRTCSGNGRPNEPNARIVVDHGVTSCRRRDSFATAVLGATATSKPCAFRTVWNEPNWFEWVTAPVVHSKKCPAYSMGDTIGRFTERFLRVDGLLILRFIAAHNGDMVSTEVCRHLWDNYLNSVKAAHARRHHMLEHPTLQMTDGYKVSEGG